MMRPILASCFLGVSLLGSIGGVGQALANGNPKPAIDAAELAQLRRRMDKTIGVDTVLRQGIGGWSRQRISEAHQAGHAMPGQIILFGHKENGLGVSLTDGSLQRLRGDRITPATRADLERFEVSNVAGLQRTVEAHLERVLPKRPTEAATPNWQLRGAATDHPDAKLIAQHQALVLAPRKQLAHARVVVASDGDGTLALEASPHHDWSEQRVDLVHLDGTGGRHADQLGILDPGKSDAFTRLGLGTRDLVGAAIEGLVVKQASQSGLHAKTTEEARNALRAEVDDAKALLALLKMDSKASERLSAVATRALLDHRPKGEWFESSVPLAADQHEQLQLVGQGSTHEGRFLQVSMRVVPHAPGTKPRPATLADLHRHKIGTTSDFENALRAIGAAGKSSKQWGKRIQLAEALRAGLPSTPELDALKAYGAATRDPAMRIAGDGSEDIVIGEGKLSFCRRYVESGVSRLLLRPLSELDFDRSGISSIEDLELAYARTLIEKAGLKGAPTDRALLAKAHAALQSKIKTITQYLHAAHDASDPMLLAQHAASAGENKSAWNGYNDIIFYKPTFLASNSDKMLLWDNGMLRVMSKRDYHPEKYSVRSLGRGASWVVNGIGTSIADNKGTLELPAATYHDLEQLKLGDRAAFDKQIVAVMATNGSLGNPASLTLAQARAAIERQTHDAPQLEKFIAGEHPDAQRMLAVYQHSHPPAQGKESAAIDLVVSPEGTIRIGHEGALYPNSDGGLAKAVLQFNGKAATVGDLRRMGLGTVEELEAALHGRMAEVARSARQ